MIGIIFIGLLIWACVIWANRHFEANNSSPYLRDRYGDSDSRFTGKSPFSNHLLQRMNSQQASEEESSVERESLRWESRLPGEPMLQQKTLREAGPWLLGEIAFLVVIYFIGGSFIPVLLLGVPATLAALFYGYVVESKARRIEHELAPVKTPGEDLYIPEEWLKDI